MNLGSEKLRVYCKGKGINPYRLSKLSGVSLTYCYRLLRGEMDNPSLSTLNRIAVGLRVEIKDLI